MGAGMRRLASHRRGVPAAPTLCLLAALLEPSISLALPDLLLVHGLAPGQPATVGAGEPVVFEVTIYNLSLSQQLTDTLD